MQLANGSPFIRDVQITGTLPGTPPPSVGYRSPVFVAGMDEGRRGLGHPAECDVSIHRWWRHLDDRRPWARVFNAVGDGTCGYFAKVNPIWRHMGWGEPAVGPNGAIHYAYAGKGQASGDNGDIYYVRSTDNGVTWSAPIKLNDDTGGQFKTQWMPSVSVNYNPASPLPQGKVTVSWYDRRSATSACNNVTDPGCSYERYGIQSADNGATFGANFAISTGLITQPAPGRSRRAELLRGRLRLQHGARFKCLRDLDRWTRRYRRRPGAERGICQGTRAVERCFYEPRTNKRGWPRGCPL